MNRTLNCLRTIDAHVSCWQQYSDGREKDVGPGDVGSEERQGEDEHGGGQIDGVEVGQAHHQATECSYVVHIVHNS